MAVVALFIILFLLLGIQSTEAQIGVCYGRLGDDLPCAQDVVKLYQKYGIGAMRLYDPDHATLQALKGTKIKLMLGVPNEDITSIGYTQSVADVWVNTNVVPYAKSIKYIVVGNEIRPYFPQASLVEPAMQNIQKALKSTGLGGQIKVSTSVDTSLIQNSYPPSNSTFKNVTYITPIINFLTTNDSPLLINVQPYFAYVDNPKDIELDFVLFKSCGTVINDNGKEYNNLFDAIYDAMYVAIEKVVTQQHGQGLQTNSSLYNGNKNKNKNKNKVPTPKVSESGYPSKNSFKSVLEMSTTQPRHINNTKLRRRSLLEDVATLENAKTYYTNLIKHVKEGKGTPLTPGQKMEVYLFAMFDENQKPGNETERHFGLFTPKDRQPKYGQLDF